MRVAANGAAQTEGKSHACHPAYRNRLDGVPVDHTAMNADRDMARNSGNPDAVAAVPDSVIQAEREHELSLNAQANSEWVMDPVTRMYVKR